MQYAYLVVEGPHDLEFVGRLLKPHGLKRIKNLSELAELWKPLVPRKFPVDDEDLLKRVPVPVFFASATHSVAVHSAIGDTRLFQTVEETLAVLPGGAPSLTGLAVLLDADSDRPPTARFGDLSKRLATLPLAWPEQPGQIGPGSPRTGIYILPDNQSAGTLEDLLLEAAGSIYPKLLLGARQYIDGIEPQGGELTRDDREEFCKPAGKNKALIACVASILKPGKAITVSLQDNRWLTGPALQQPRIRRVQSFLEQLLELGQQAA